eukprot:c5301_g1_i1 orf=412-1470(-)
MAIPKVIKSMFLFCALIILLICCESIDASYTSSLTPPPGNSIQMKTTVVNGSHFYRCADGDWLLESAHATLVDSSNLRSVVGNFSFAYQRYHPRYVGTWALINSQGDFAESGAASSLVAGMQIASFSLCKGNLSEYLAEASMHKSTGAASLISYIARYNTSGGAAPTNGYCEDQTLIRIPFHANFFFWKQDTVPSNVPSQLAVPSQQRPIEGFFTKGAVEYIFNGTNWIQKGIMAKMYDIPGGTQVGRFFVRSEADKLGGTYCWEISNPYGFQIVGKNACNPMSVTSGSLPWSLHAITSSSGNTSLLGPYTYVQTVSTRGGLPPRTPSACIPSVGQIWRSSFTGIYWFFSMV